mgnify:CR=1 FL=1
MCIRDSSWTEPLSSSERTSHARSGVACSVRSWPRTTDAPLPFISADLRKLPLGRVGGVGGGAQPRRLGGEPRAAAASARARLSMISMGDDFDQLFEQHRARALLGAGGGEAHPGAEEPAQLEVRGDLHGVVGQQGLLSQILMNAQAVA